MSKPIASASHRKTNDVIFALIAARLTPDARVVDFGAGRGHMAQRVGNYFAEQGRVPAEHVIAFEIVPECFQYEEVKCRKIGTDSLIPVENSSLDLVYAIEVLEHTPRPYDFFLNAFAALKPGGTLIFSVPNLLHMQSRLSFLFTGFAEMFGPPSSLEKNAGRICGHIMPLSYPYFVYGLRKAGFTGMEFYADRIKRSSRAMALLCYPLLRLASNRSKRKLQQYDAEVWTENHALVDRINRLDVLSSRSCIVVAQKPAK